MESVGIRALKQNASAVVARAAAGESIEITDRGRPVARLVPLPPPSDDPLQQLVDAGTVVPPKKPWDHSYRSLRKLTEELEAQGLPTGNLSGMTMKEILDEQRADRL